MPKAEVILWSKIKNKQLGERFLRQYSVEKYVLDFYCPRLLLAIEIDGDVHYLTETKIAADNARQQFIEKLGITFLRFTNIDIYKNLDGVLIQINETIKKLNVS
jgi:very-short-patch-repair endonuclease